MISRRNLALVLVGMVVLGLIGTLGPDWRSTLVNAQEQNGDGALVARVTGLEARLSVLETRTAGATVPLAGTHAVRGALRLAVLGSDEHNIGGACDYGQTLDGFLTEPEAFQEGGGVVALDGTGAAIAGGQLGPRGLVSEGSNVQIRWWCVFPFTILDVPDTTVYGFRIGNEIMPSRSRSDLESTNWTTILEIDYL